MKISSELSVDKENMDDSVLVVRVVVTQSSVDRASTEHPLHEIVQHELYHGHPHELLVNQLDNISPILKANQPPCK